MTNLVEPQWGLPFDVEELEMAVGLTADIGRPLSISLEHEGSDEVLEVLHRAQSLRADG